MPISIIRHMKKYDEFPVTFSKDRTYQMVFEMNGPKKIRTEMYDIKV